MSDRIAARMLPSLPADGLVRQLGGFLLVGGAGWIVDASVFNVLRATVLDPADVHGGAMIAKAVSTSIAIALNWIGNRSLAFRGHAIRGAGRRSTAGEAARFLAASLLGASVSVLCLVVSRDLLGLTSALSDNVSANVVGLALGTVLRFVLYRAWVFSGRAVVASS